MNFIFISPQFPNTYWQFCRHLKANGVNVLGIADTPYDQIDPRLKDALTEYYKVDSMEDYNQVFKAVAFLSYKHGKIDGLESNNEYWLEQDARLRTDFNIPGIKLDSINSIKEKSEMKKYYAMANIPTARQIKASEGLDAVLAFTAKTGFPIIAKPDVGVGADDTHKIHDEAELKEFYQNKGEKFSNYVVEEFITGDICAYDAVIDSKGEPIFESMTSCPPSIMDIVNKSLDLSYYVAAGIPEKISIIGRKTVKAFNVKSRFVHLEFFRLDSKREGLGDKGDFVALEVNMRPAGGYTPEMMNYSHSVDVYKIWADMIAKDKSDINPDREEFFCVFVSRRDRYNYVHTHQEILDKYGSSIVQHERMPEILQSAMGQQMYTVKVRTEEEMNSFIEFVHAKK